MAHKPSKRVNKKRKSRAARMVDSTWGRLMPILLQMIIILPAIATVFVSQCNTEETNERLEEENDELREQNRRLLESGKELSDEVLTLRSDAQRVINLLYLQLKQNDSRLRDLEELQGWKVSAPLMDIIPQALSVSSESIIDFFSNLVAEEQSEVDDSDPTSPAPPTPEHNEDDGGEENGGGGVGGDLGVNGGGASMGGSGQKPGRIPLPEGPVVYFPLEPEVVSPDIPHKKRRDRAVPKDGMLQMRAPSKRPYEELNFDK